ncbi:MAG: SGNH/GDSL hydrolase family protein [Sciscionella sp.]|nr:SGNH/GDSL hydrolase family protein [Sciscionella sp.]
MARKSGMRVGAVIGAVIATAAIAVGLAPQASASTPTYHEYVALGDSYSADVVVAGVDGTPTTKYVPLGCFQSTYDYPKQVAKALGVPAFYDATCGGATTDDFTGPESGLAFGGKNAPQFGHLTKSTDLVTVGIGGNDIGFADDAEKCINFLPKPMGTSCAARFTAGGVDQISARIAAAEPKVVGALNQIHQIAPLARVLLVNYLDAIPPTGCWPYVPVWNADMAYLYAKFNEMNGMLANAANAGGAELVDTYTPTVGHDVCRAPNQRYVESVVPLSINDPAIAVPLHPNSAGANAQARIVLQHITG